MARIIDGAEMNLIGSNLKRLRQERGWSQQLLSNKLETVAVYICRGSISRIEDKQATMARERAYRKFQLTINNPLEHGFAHEIIRQNLEQLKSCLYWCLCDEIGEQGTPHTHVYTGISRRKGALWPT